MKKSDTVVVWSRCLCKAQYTALPILKITLMLYQSSTFLVRDLTFPMMIGGKEDLYFLLLDYILTLAWHPLRHVLSSCRITGLATGSSVVFLNVPGPECESARSWVYRNTKPFHSELPLIMTNVKKTVGTIKLQKRRLRSIICKNWNLKKRQNYPQI